jgi:hypothetical protein
VAAEGAKEKTFYIVKEFEAHLRRFENASLDAAAMNAAAIDHHVGQPSSPYQQGNHHHSIHPGTPLVDVITGPSGDPVFDLCIIIHQNHHHHHATKTVPVKASHSYQKRDPWTLPELEVTITSDGKIRCGCGGTRYQNGNCERGCLVEITCNDQEAPKMDGRKRTLGGSLKRYSK